MIGSSGRIGLMLYLGAAAFGIVLLVTRINLGDSAPKLGWI